MNFLELGSRVCVEHVRHPLALYRLDRVEDSWPTRCIRFSSQLIPKFIQCKQYLFLLKASKRHILEVAVDVCPCDERMMISFNDEIEVDMFVFLHELLQGG